MYVTGVGFEQQFKFALFLFLDFARDVSPQLPASATVPLLHHHGLLSPWEPQAQLNLFFY